MNQAKLESLLLTEIHQLIAAAARGAVSKLGCPVPSEARVGYLTAAELDFLGGVTPVDLENPVLRKAMAASIASNNVLSYPPDGEITEDDAVAIESLRLTEAQRLVMERFVAEACHKAFFHFLCLLDSVGDPELTPVKHWAGARFTYRREEGEMLHDKLGDAYFTFRERTRG